MRTPMICKNCGIKWMRVVDYYGDIELNSDLCSNCPKCGSNWCEPIEPNEEVKP